MRRWGSGEMMNSTSAPGTWNATSETANFLPDDVRADIRIHANVAVLMKRFIAASEVLYAGLRDRSRRSAARVVIQMLEHDLPVVEDEARAIECEWWEEQ